MEDEEGVLEVVVAAAEAETLAHQLVAGVGFFFDSCSVSAPAPTSTSAPAPTSTSAPAPTSTSAFVQIGREEDWDPEEFDSVVSVIPAFKFSIFLAVLESKYAREVDAPDPVPAPAPHHGPDDYPHSPLLLLQLLILTKILIQLCPFSFS